MLANTNVIDRGVIEQCLEIHPQTMEAGAEHDILQGSLKEVEQRYLQHLMRLHNADKEQVAKIAGISLRSLYRKLQESVEAQGR